MGQQSRKPRVPRARQQTERQTLIELMVDAPLQTAKELSGCAGISEKDVYRHLEHIEKSLKKDGYRLFIEPASCCKCGFTFTKNGRFNKPGRCPECKHQRITLPAYLVQKRD